jgi:SWI/SNF-related matrix-associated actin-dependent regulator of chromatin subfamily B protein 1
MFEGIMKHAAVARDTNQIIRPDTPQEAENVKYQWVPRIKCLDCPGKLYTASPENAAENFEVHLMNRKHKDKVEPRRAAQRRGGT